MYIDKLQNMTYTKIKYWWRDSMTHCFPFSFSLSQKLSNPLAGHAVDTHAGKALLSRLNTWWRHQMETFSALLALCAGNSPVPGEVPAQRPVTRSFDIFFDLRLNKRLRKQSWGWWFETLLDSLWRHCNAMWKSRPQYIGSFVRVSMFPQKVIWRDPIIKTLVIYNGFADYMTFWYLHQ